MVRSGLCRAVGMALLVLWPNLFSLLIALVGIYRALNMGRIIRRRMHEAYLRSATRRTGWKLISLQLLVGIGWWAGARWHVTGHGVWTAVALLQVLVVGLLLLSTIRTLKRTRWVTPKEHYNDEDLPSITIAIPARNETEDLKECLLSVIASDYPKFEVLVLDDCSQMRRTPEIIREFAHDGVRFVQGQEPNKTWLPKNQAYAKLASEASGAYILFCGVDVRFRPGTIREMVTVMLARKKQMLCVLPVRHDRVRTRSSVVQAVRYLWELILPRRHFNRPPVLSTCWIIATEALHRAGGFAAVTRAIVPEAHFAKALISEDRYSFLRASEALGVQSTKGLRDQRDTAIRMRYPQLHKRPEQTALISCLELFFLVMPWVMLFGGFAISIGVASQLLSLVAVLLLVGVYESVVVATRTNSRFVGLIMQPFAALLDVGLLNYSMWKYEFSTVDWKGRDIGVPVMHVAQHLPYDERI